MLTFLVAMDSQRALATWLDAFSGGEESSLLNYADGDIVLAVAKDLFTNHEFDEAAAPLSSLLACLSANSQVRHGCTCFMPCSH